MLRSLIQALKAERIKSRHTKSRWMLFAFAASMPVLYIIISLVENIGWSNNSTSPPQNYFDQIENISTAFAMLIYPMSMVIITAQVAAVEHKNNTWQLIETQAIHKWAIYLAKWFKVMLQLAWVVLLFYGISYLLFTGWYYLKFSNSTNYYLQFDVGAVASRICNMYCSGLAYLALFFVLHINMKKTNLITSLGLAMVIGFLMAKGFDYSFPHWFPLFFIDIAAGKLSEIGNFITYFSKYSIIESVLILVVGYFFYAYKSHKRFFFQTQKALGSFALLVLVGTGIILWLQMPKYQKSHGITIINGHIDADVPINKVGILDGYQNLILEIPVEDNGNFYLKVSNGVIAKAKYMFVFPELKAPIVNKNGELDGMFMAEGDSIYAAIKFKNNFTEIAISGDRRAEVRGAMATNPGSLQQLGMIANYEAKSTSSVEEMLTLFKNAYKKDRKDLQNIVTVDGYQIAPDVFQYQLSLLNLHYWNQWQVSLRTYFAEKQNETFPFMEEIKKSIQEQDPDLWNNEHYVTYKFAQLNNNNAEISSLKLLELAAQFHDPKEQEYAYAYALNEVMDNTTIADTVALQLFDTNIGQVKIDKFKRSLIMAQQERLAHLKTDPLPEFIFHDAADKQQSLQQYLGKYVVVDVWATWCSPCSYQSPYFYDYAEKFKDKNIVFLALSIDHNVKAWKAKKTSNNYVVNWIADTGHPFLKYFVIQGLPRFLLIDPLGKPVVQKMPEPSSPIFEEYLNKYLNL